MTGRTPGNASVLERTQYLNGDALAALQGVLDAAQAVVDTAWREAAHTALCERRAGRTVEAPRFVSLDVLALERALARLKRETGA